MPLRRSWFLAAALAVSLALAAPALAHVERTAYWPDPAPDTSVTPPAGGKVPKARSLASALRRVKGTKVRVVCQPGSMKRAKREIRRAHRSGYRNRPTEKLRKLSARQAKRWLTLNRRFWKKCRYHEIQPAVTASGNNGRVVVMPGVYTEPTSRRVSSFPPECDKYRETSEKGAGAVSYAYQVHCPNAQNLIAVIGRADTGKPDPPSSPTGRADPHGLPNAGPCIRCNFQIEGSGPAPDDTVVDAGRVASGDGAPIGAVKDVALKADRADGFVFRDMTLRHAAEHDIYVLETDGYLLERGRYMYAGEYGTLTFTSDHGLTYTCEAMGNGDAGVYPGGAPDTGAQRDASFYPERRLNQTITGCDLHHNNMGSSGTMGNAVHIVRNNYYGNASGIVTDSFYAGGHPGFPQDSGVYEDNNVYSNNFNVYGPQSDVASRTAVPIGVGVLIAGGNDDAVLRNHIYDNWRRGTMLVAVPDAISCAPTPSEGAPPCAPQGAATTSQRDHYYENQMGRSPSGKVMPNGVDFWWDEFPSDAGNCWDKTNRGSDGNPGTFTTDPPRAPGDATLPGFMPVQDCDSPTNSGKGNPQKEAVLLSCAEEVQGRSNDQQACDWFVPPAKPGSEKAQAQARRQSALTADLAQSGFPALPKICTLIGGEGGTLTCSPFQHRLGG
jgi:hypothetical protein